MNNQQLIETLRPIPAHSIHRIQTSPTFRRWLTFTAQQPTNLGTSFIQFRTAVLDALFEDWQRFRSETIEAHL